MQGDTYNFLLPDSMQADKEAGKFLEANTVDGFHGSAMFGIAFSAVSSMAATGDPLRPIMSAKKLLMVLPLFMSVFT